MPSTSPTSTRQYLIGWQRAAGQEMDVGVLAADEQDSFSRLDAGVNFRRQHIADEGIAQRDQVHIRGEEKSRKIFERNQARSVNGHATRAKLTFDPIGLRSRGIQPKPKAVLRLPKVFGVRFDECVLIMGNAPIARVKDDPGSAAQLIRQRLEGQALV